MVRTRILPIALGIAWLLLLPSCGGEPAAGATGAPTTVAPSSSGATAERSAEEAVAAAVGEMLKAEAYSFEGTVTITSTSDAEFQVSGWVNGKDSEISLTTGGQTVITRVLSGVATVEQGGVMTEIPLGEAGDAPSLEILTELKKSEFVTDGSVRGTLTAADLRASGFDVNGVAFVMVFLSDGGDISGYTMTPNNGGWSVEMSFSKLTV
jgi:hypothetical protein